MTKKIKLISPDGSTHKEYEAYNEFGEWYVDLGPMSTNGEVLRLLGFKIEEVKLPVEEKRREFWIDDDWKIYDSEMDCTHFVELKPGEKIFNKEQIETAWRNANVESLTSLLKELGFEETE